MSKMKLVVIDNDSYFIDMFSAYIRTSEYGQTFTLTAFSSREHGIAFIESLAEPCILLVHEAWMPLPDKAFMQQLGCLILLSDAGASLDILEYPVLCKYQPLNQLLSHLISHYNEYSSSRMIKGNRSTEVISVYSAVGGTGKTLTSVHLARELGLLGRKVFYLNLEQLPSVSWMEPSGTLEENHLARILYFGKKDPKLQIARIERYKRKHTAMGFDYFPGGFEPAEVMDMTMQDTETLIQSLVQSGVYDCVIADLDSCLYPRIRSCLQQSDLVLWLAADDRVQLEKTRMLLKLLTTQDDGNRVDTAQIKLVVNKFSGSLTNPDTEWPLPIAGYLPYMPEWKSYPSVEKLQPRGVFSESIAALPLIHHEIAKEKAYGAR